jgi:sporulation protein YlmC with PRC-barrel domain
MVHLSEILGLPVFDSENKRLGKLDDLRIDPLTGLVKHILIRRNGNTLSVFWSQIETFSPETRKVGLREGAEMLPAGGCEGETLCVKRNVLDRQIIDTNGRKVVRVNDVLLELSNSELYLRRVEVGLAGAVRRLVAGILAPRLVRHLAGGLSERGIPWDYVGLVETQSAQIRLKVHQQLARLHPADVADIIEDLGRIERKELVSLLDTETAAQALSEVEPSVQATVVEDMQVEKAADLLEEMQPDEAADILGDLPEERSKALLEAMEKDEAEEVGGLMSFDEDTAGGLMTTEFFRADPGWTVGRTLTALREADPDLLGEMDEIPLTDTGGRLVGIVPLVRLVRRAPDEPVTSAMRRDARAVLPSAPLEEVVERFEKYHLRGLAVTDQFGALIGLITIEDLLSRLAQKA